MPGPLEHDLELMSQRPLVPGEAVEYIYIPARGFMTGRLVKKGQVLRIIDLEGQQVADTIIWDADNLDNVLSVGYTRHIHKKWTKKGVGGPYALYSKYSEKLATLTRDTVGEHAFAGTCCSWQSNYARYGIPGTPNCRDNFVLAMAAHGFTAKNIEMGSCISFFMNENWNPDGTFEINLPTSKAGDYLDILAERDIIIAISNCPQERNACNAFNPTSLMVVIFNPDPTYLPNSHD
jgi:uncharacterized protein YcgI (DUF1989 family)